MAHGQPDYGMYSLASTIYKLSDMGELAARLGSPSTFDRRGDTVISDSFEGGLAAYRIDGSGLNFTVTEEANFARFGGFCVRLTHGSTLDREARVEKFFPLQVAGRWGFEISFTFNVDLEAYNFAFFLRRDTDIYRAELDLVVAGRILRYRDVDGNYQPIQANVPVYANPRLFNTIKMVVDFDTKKYVRAILNETEWDLSAFTPYTYAGPVENWVSAWARITGPALFNHFAFVDGFIVTQNEP